MRLVCETHFTVDIKQSLCVSVECFGAAVPHFQIKFLLIPSLGASAAVAGASAVVFVGIFSVNSIIAQLIYTADGFGIFRRSRN